MSAPTKIKLLHVTTVPQTLGFLTRLVRYVKSQGFEVRALSSPGERLQRFGREAEVPVHAVPMARRITPWRDLLAVWRITRIIHLVRPQIVHGHTPKGGLLAMLAAWLCGVPLRIYHLYGLPLLTARGPKRWLLRCTEKLSCRLAHQVLCLSHSLCEVVVAQRLCPADKIKVLLAGNIDGTDATDRFNPDLLPADTRIQIRQHYGIPEDAQAIGFVGRMVRDKGMGELVEAWQRLRNEFPKLHLLIAGSPEAHAPLPGHIEAALHRDPRIH